MIKNLAILWILGLLLFGWGRMIWARFDPIGAGLFSWIIVFCSICAITALSVAVLFQ